MAMLSLPKGQNPRPKSHECHNYGRELNEHHNNASVYLTLVWK